MRQMRLNKLTPLFFFIPISMLIVTFIGIGICSTKVYSNIITTITRSESVEIPLSYINSKIKRNIDSKVYIKEIQGQDVLILSEEYDGEIYETWIYCYEGRLYEAFMLKGMELDLRDGIEVMELYELQFSCKAIGLLEVTVGTGDGNRFTKLIKIETEVI